MAATNLSEMSPLEKEQYGISRSNTVGKMMTFSEILLVKHTSECSLVSYNMYMYTVYIS